MHCYHFFRSTYFVSLKWDILVWYQNKTCFIYTISKWLVYITICFRYLNICVWSFSMKILHSGEINCFIHGIVRIYIQLLTYIRKWKPQKPHFCHFRSIFIRYTFPYIFALKLYIHISLSVISMHLHKVPHLILFHLQKIWTNWGINVFWSLCLAFPADVRWKKKTESHHFMFKV